MFVISLFLVIQSSINLQRKHKNVIPGQKTHFKFTKKKFFTSKTHTYGICKPKQINSLRLICFDRKIYFNQPQVKCLYGSAAKYQNGEENETIQSTYYILFFFLCSPTTSDYSYNTINIGLDACKFVV